MQLENRYIVLKLKDVKELNEQDGLQLDTLCDKITAKRRGRGFVPLECLVIEKHWPEYEPALEMLSARVDGVGPFVWVKRHECTNSDRWNCKYCSTVKTCEANKEQLNSAFGKFGAPPAPPAAAEEAAEFKKEAWDKVLNFGGAPGDTSCPLTFRSSDCGYTGPRAGCAKTLAACRELSNEARFRGEVPLGRYGKVVQEALGPIIWYTDPAKKPADEPVVKHSHYKKDVRHLHTIDVYRVLDLYNVTDPCIQHAIKKLMVAGGRGAGKDAGKDIREAIDSLERWQEMQAEDKPVNPFAEPPLTAKMVRDFADKNHISIREAREALINQRSQK